MSDKPVPTELWHDSVAPLVTLADRFAASGMDEQQLLALFQQLLSGISMAYMGLFLGNSAYPDFWPNVNQAYNFLAPNPDSVYYVAQLDHQGTYSLSGFRGSVRTIDVQVGSGSFFTRGDVAAPSANLASYDLDELQMGKQGDFEVVLSAARPAGYTGNWWKLDKGASYLLVRQTAYDWIAEVDGRFAIERLDVPAARPPHTKPELEELLRSVSTWAENWSALGEKWVASYREQGMVNTLFVRGLTDVGGVDGQSYIEGQFELGQDEALIYETELPDRCHYWNVQLTDLRWSTLDYTHHQTSLNGHYAKLDKDGKFRAVISARDPGVANWLDTVGQQQGAILGRWTRCSSAPTPTLRKVKLDEVLDHLPADTALLSPQERDLMLRLRRKGIQLRRRW